MKNFLLVLIVFSIGTYSAKSSRIDLSVHPFEEFLINQDQDQDTENWKFLKEVDNVKVYYTSKLCNDNPLFFFKVVNDNNFAVMVEWESEIILYENHIPVNEKFQYVLSSKSSVTGSCDNKSLTLNPYNYVSSVNEESTSYTIKNLIIEKK